MSTPELRCIYLDLDGVIVDLVGGMARLWELPEAQLPELRRRLTDWDAMPAAISALREEAGLEGDVTMSRLWNRVARTGRKFWAELEWTPRGQALYELCRATAPVVIMSTPTRSPSSAAGKLSWINTKLPQEARRRYALTPCKHHFAHPGALLIDDAPHNVDAFREHGGEAFLWPQPWNGTPDPDHEAALAALRARLVSS